MTEHTWFIIAIIIYMATMLAIGYWSYKQTDEYDDYMLAGRDLNPFVAALSAGASDMSGWLLMGLPGAIFISGLSALWIAIGLIIGCWANWFWVAPRLRSYSEVADNSITIPSFVENRVQDKSRVLRIVSSLVIMVFFTFYVSSGMVAGGKEFVATFGTSYLDGMLIIAAVTVAYTFIGGFLAVSYTDAVQGTIMFLALILVPIVAIVTMQHPGDIFSFASHHDYGPYTSGVGNPTYFSLFGGVGIAAIISNLAWGLGYFGQPHIIVRFMAIRGPKECATGRRVGIFWMLFCIAGATMVAIIGTAFFGEDPSIAITDRHSYETIFLDMSRILFHPLIAGLVLTAVLAAIMSTISSQLLVTSSALVEDLYKIVVKSKPSNTVLINLSRTAVVAVAVCAALLAVHPSESILGLVAFAWAGFGSAFGPLVLFSLYWRRLNTPGAIAGMVVGAVVSFTWGRIPELHAALYEIVPGFIASTIAIILVSLVTRRPSSSTLRQFDDHLELIRLAKRNPNESMSAAHKKMQHSSPKAD